MTEKAIKNEDKSSEEVQEPKIPEREILSQENSAEAIKNTEMDKEIKEMFDASLHFGHTKSRKNPKMADFIYATRNNIDIIDLLRTKECLENILGHLKNKKKEGALILFVGTKVSAKDIIKELADETKMPYVTERWLGGTLTNFDVINQRINYLKEQEEKMERGEFKDLTKKERLKISQEVERIKKKIGGLRNLTKLPDLLFVVDIREERAAIGEAKLKGIPVVGICDTDGNPSLVDHIIPANDDAVSSLKYILSRIKESLVS